MKRSLLILSSSLLCISGIGASAEVAYVDNVYIEPFYYGSGITNISFYVRGTKPAPIDVHLYIVNDNYPSGISIFSGTYNTIMVDHIQYDNSYTAPYGNVFKLNYTNKAMKVKGTLQRANLVAIGGSSEITSPNYSFTSKNHYQVHTKTNSWEEFSETISFCNFYDTSVPNYYHKIDLSEYKVRMDASKTKKLCFDESYLLISDETKKLKNFNRDQKYVQIPVTFIEEDTGLYHLEFEDKLFVNANTLEMSPIFQKNFIETKYFYLPSDNVKSHECHLYLNGVGLDHEQFHFSFNYIPIYQLIGDCRNSEYCVINR